MYQLIYCSRPTAQVNLEMAKSIVTSARKYNRELGVTGVLFYNADYFFQCLEGDRYAVNKIFSRISKDPRHEDLHITQYDPISERSFAHWSMGLATATEANNELYLKYCAKQVFDPYRLTHGAGIKLLVALSKSAAIF